MADIQSKHLMGDDDRGSCLTKDSNAFPRTRSTTQKPSATSVRDIREGPCHFTRIDTG